MDNCCVCGSPIDVLTNKCKTCKLSNEEIKRPPSKYLSKIFKEIKTSSSTSFETCKNNLIDKYDFKLLNTPDSFDLYEIDTSDKNRIFSKGIYFTNKIIDKDLKCLHLVDSQKIQFVNCIFKCAINISEISQKLNTLIIDQCIFLDKLMIYSVNEMSSLNINHSNINNLVIKNLYSKETFISSCKISSFTMESVKSAEFTSFDNKINNFDFSRNIFDEITFDYKQLNLKMSLQNYLKHINLPRFAYDDCETTLNLLTFEDISENETLENSYFNNIDFLRSYTDIETDKDAYNDILLLESILHQKKNISKRLMWIFGGFVKPKNFIIISISVILIFSLIYLSPFAYFNVNGETSARHLNFLETLYFSGISFTTIGYGDISPIGFSRIFAVTEGFLGVLISSSLLTSFIRKYIN